MIFPFCSRPTYRSAALLLPFCMAFAAPLSAQAAGPSHSAGEVSVRAGAALYSTGDDVNCARGPSVVGGVQARTPGTWFLAASGDVHVGLPFVCTLVGTSIRYGGDRYADESGGVHFEVAPQLGIRAGRTVPVRGAELAPTLGGGGIYATHLFSSTDRVWMPWAGVSLGVHRPGRRLGLDVEYSQYRVPIQHEIYRDNGGHPQYLETRRFGRWKPMIRLSLRAPL
jgi:hypothetical protein